MHRLIVLLILLVFISCGQKADTTKTQTSTNSEAQTTTSTNSGDVKMNPKYPHIPQAELGITVVSEDGWDAKTLEFHLGYCEKMMASLNEEYETSVFCDCFVKKIQYYYEPIFFKEAYTDQKTWNQDCLKAASKEEK